MPEVPSITAKSLLIVKPPKALNTTAVKDQEELFRKLDFNRNLLLLR